MLLSLPSSPAPISVLSYWISLPGSILSHASLHHLHCSRSFPQIFSPGIPAEDFSQPLLAVLVIFIPLVQPKIFLHQSLWMLCYPPDLTQAIPFLMKCGNTRGNRMDIGPGTSHKAKIVELYLKGYEFTDIKRNTRHSSESIARYLKEFEFKGKTWKLKEI